MHDFIIVLAIIFHLCQSSVCSEPTESFDPSESAAGSFGNLLGEVHHSAHQHLLGEFRSNPVPVIKEPEFLESVKA